MKISCIKKLKIMWAFIVCLSIFSQAPLAIAQEAMSSGTYVIQSDSINFAGARSESTSYSIEDTLGESATGNIASVNFGGEIGYQAMLVLVAGDTVAPSTPPSINATGITSSRIEVTWGESTDNVAVTRYNIYRNGSLIADVGVFPRSFTDTGLSPDTLYSYNVSAVDDALNESSLSATASARTLAISSSLSGALSPILYNLSIVPTERLALVKFDTTIPVKATISWGLDGSYATGKISIDNFNSSHSFILPNLLSSRVYSLKIDLTRQDGHVTTFENINFLTLSLPNLVTPPNAIDFNATPGSEDIALSWKMPLDPSINAVRIIRSKDFYLSSPNEGEIIFEGFGTEYVDRNVEKGVKYYYTLFTKDISGNFSSGSAADAYIPSPGEVVIPGEPFDDIEISGDVHPLIASLALNDFLFIQDGKILSTRSDRVLIDGSKNLTVALRAYRVPPVLKTIAVTLATQEEEPKYFTFILKMNEDGTRYEAVVAPLGESNTYTLKITIVDFDNKGLRKLQGTMLVSTRIAWDALGLNSQMIFLFVVILILLALLIMWWQRRKDKEVIVNLTEQNG